jgi:excisionase family DNA binding protein
MTTAAEPDGHAIGLGEAANRLGVHYMTAYRYVRTGKLPALKVQGQWRVDPADLDGLHELEPPARPRRAQRTWATARLLDRLLAGDEIGAWELTESALSSGADPGDVELELIAPALREIGEQWAAGRLDIGDEHRASVVARRLLSRLGPRFNRRGRKRGTVVVGAVEGELHEVPGAIVADQLRAAGFEVVDLGADTPASSFVIAAHRFRPGCVLVSVTGSGHEQAVADTVASLRAKTSAVVLVGGAAVPDERIARSLGSERWTGLDARQVVAVVEELAGG